MRASWRLGSRPVFDSGRLSCASRPSRASPQPDEACRWSLLVFGGCGRRVKTVTGGPARWMNRHNGWLADWPSQLRPEPIMTVTRSVADALSEHAVFEVECIDRMFCNVYVPGSQYAPGLAACAHRQLGSPIASTAPLARITEAFDKAVHRFARDHGLPRGGCRHARAAGDRLFRQPTSAARPTTRPRPDHRRRRARHHHRGGRSKLPFATGEQTSAAAARPPRRCSWVPPRLRVAGWPAAPRSRRPFPAAATVAPRLGWSTR